MKFQDFLHNGLIKRVKKDEMLIKSILKTSKEDLEFLSSLEINNNSARKITANYYDVLRGILEAIALLKGYKIYEHEAFTYFLREIINEDSLSIKFDRLRRIRNKINYYGTAIGIEEAKENTSEMKEIINILIKKYFQEISK